MKMSGGHIVVDDRVLALVGKTREEIRRMTLDEFHDLVLDRGYTIEVSWKKAPDGKGRLRISMSDKEQLVSPPAA